MVFPLHIIYHSMIIYIYMIFIVYTVYNCMYIYTQYIHVYVEIER